MCYLTELFKSLFWSKIDKTGRISCSNCKKRPLTENEEIPREEDQLVPSSTNHITVLHRGDEKRIPISYAEEESVEDLELRKVEFRITSLSLQLSSHQREENKLMQRWLRDQNPGDEEKLEKCQRRVQETSETLRRTKALFRRLQDDEAVGIVEDNLFE